MLKLLSCFYSKESCCHFKLGEIDYLNLRSNVKKKLSVNDVYSDSENECDATENLSKDTV